VVAVRPAITATTGGAGNVPVSILEDVVATLVSVLSIVLPILVVVFLVLFAVLIFVWLRNRAKKKRSAYN
jgi:Flp pilus assembly protein TadB